MLPAANLANAHHSLLHAIQCQQCTLHFSRLNTPSTQLQLSVSTTYEIEIIVIQTPAHKVTSMIRRSIVGSGIDVFDH